MFKFEHALKEMAAGKDFIRDSWTFDKGYTVLINGAIHIYRVILLNGMPQINFANLGVDDMTAEDWREVTKEDIARLQEATTPKPPVAPETPATTPV